MKLKVFLYFYLVIWLLFPCAVYMTWVSGYQVLIGTCGTEFLIQTILNCAAALCGAALAFLHYRETRRTLINKAALFLAAAGIVSSLSFVNFFCMFLDSGQEYHSFRSPDGTHDIVIMENISIIAGRVTIFERVNPFLITQKGELITDDGYRPVCAGEYSLIWHGDTATLTVADGAGGQKTLSVTLNGQ